MIESKTTREKRAVAILAEKDAINKIDDGILAVKSQTGGTRTGDARPTLQHRIENTVKRSDDSDPM